jgi:hypothetical protein
MMSVYLSGPITGMPNGNYDAFLSAELRIRRPSATEHTYIFVRNPQKIPHKKQNPTYADYMRDGIVAMLECDAVVMLPGWVNSRGACIERAVAHACGLKIYPSVEMLLEEFHGRSSRD